MYVEGCTGLGGKQLHVHIDSLTSARIRTQGDWHWHRLNGLEFRISGTIMIDERGAWRTDTVNIDPRRHQTISTEQREMLRWEVAEAVKRWARRRKAWQQIADERIAAARARLEQASQYRQRNPDPTPQQIAAATAAATAVADRRAQVAEQIRQLQNELRSIDATIAEPRRLADVSTRRTHYLKQIEDDQARIVRTQEQLAAVDAAHTAPPEAPAAAPTPELAAVGIGLDALD